ncbi:MAG: ASKHA domain-containing protein [Candidatus Bathyarchaeia archaeon]
MEKGIEICFQPEGKRLTFKPDATVLEAAKETGVGIRSDCGGEGSCGKCRVIIKNHAEVSGVTAAEQKYLSSSELTDGLRLACCTRVQGNLLVMVPSESRTGKRKIQAQGAEQHVKLNPAVRKLYLELQKPTIVDVQPDFERLLESLQKRGFADLEIDYELLQTLPNVLREAEWKVTATVWNDEKIVSVEHGNTEKNEFGFSVDIGTSKIVGYLVDLTSGKTVAVKSAENPQLAHGEDVISRITYAQANDENFKELHQALIETINSLIVDACQESNVNTRDVYEVTVVGNTAMHHFFLGIQPKNLLFAPYVPAIKKAVNVKAASLEITANPSGNVHVLPNIAGFVGADAVADVLATGMHKMSKVCLLMDIGTNGEVFVGNKQSIVACSCAAGPAFEGMHIEYGMKAGTGAIERVKIDAETLDVEFVAIDDGKPVGICGSGVVDAVAEMFRCGVINQRGDFNKNLESKRLRAVNGETKFVVAWKNETILGSDITISRRDIQEMQLAKAALHTGATVLMNKRNVVEAGIEHVYIAGAFGKYLNPESAKLIGLIPDVATQKIEFVGNTAVSGAKITLLSRQARKEAQRISASVNYVELMTAPCFRKEFLDSVFLPHRNIAKYPSVQNQLQRLKIL